MELRWGRSPFQCTRSCPHEDQSILKGLEAGCNETSLLVWTSGSTSKFGVPLAGQGLLLGERPEKVPRMPPSGQVPCNCGSRGARVAAV